VPFACREGQADPRHKAGEKRGSINVKSKRFLVRPLSLLLVVLGLLRVVEIAHASGTWTSTGNMTVARSYHTATLLPDGNVLVAGGVNYRNSTVLASAELYNPSSGTWTSTGNTT